MIRCVFVALLWLFTGCILDIHIEWRDGKGIHITGWLTRLKRWWRGDK